MTQHCQARRILPIPAVYWAFPFVFKCDSLDRHLQTVFVSEVRRFDQDCPGLFQEDQGNPG